MSVVDIIVLLCAVGCGLIAGVFFAFSTSVMAALGRMPAPQGILAMQNINIVILNPLFLGVFLGTAIVCGVALAASLWQPSSVRTYWMAAGALAYLAGTFIVTIRFNVPRNNVLARLSPESPEAEGVWRDYLSAWTAWNHVRAVASLAAAVCFIVAAMLRPV